MLAEAEPGAEGEAHEPVGAKMADHRRARISSAAESTGGDGLDAIEKLEGGAGGEQDDGVVDEHGIVGVNAGDVLREDEKDEAHDGHERGAEQDGGVAGEACADEIAATDRLADADGGGGRDAEGNHVGEGDGVESDLVAGKRDGAETGDQRGNGCEDGDFGGHLHGSGKTQGNKAADAIEVGAKRGFAHVGLVSRVVPEKKNDEDRGEVGARDGGGDAGADDTEHGKSPVAEDEEIVAEEIDEVGGDEREGDGADEIHALEGAAKSEVEEQRDESEGEGVHVGTSEDGDVWGNSEAVVEIGKEPDASEKQGREGGAEVDAVDEGVEAVIEAAGTEGL